MSKFKIRDGVEQQPKTTISFHVTKGEHYRLKKIANAKQLRLTHLAREMIRHCLEDMETPE